MAWTLVPSILLPTFTWRHRVLGSVALASSIPPAPQLAHRTVRRLVGFLHSYLPYISIRYCAWVGIPFDNQIVQLPFGLVLKWSDGTRLEEVSAMMIARSAGFPVPLVISYGDHPDTPHAPVSILMTRLPGKDLGQVHEHLSDEERQTICEEMHTMQSAMRSWPHPWGGERICSVVGTSIRSVRIPGHSIEPCKSESEFNDHLLSVASEHDFPCRSQFEQKLACVRKLHSVRHSIVFTHGDLKHHNIMVHDGHVSGFIDWESAGWYPDYWEFTTALRYCRKNFWWYEFVSQLGGSEYSNEMESERALTSLTVDSYTW
ncbi:kinase-like protein [Melanomma pulvis-pyrius CBS 109.77]|uniref:Kinase-like protein n=1 Tax=Melanomma pulvis-pyrius CBS 109.77 TaxID=1314802 RepID=A0A6A6WN35_9PLEO|nr:kinase-like protein [Melanomma pulvis-pyrius CBS 109.77]